MARSCPPPRSALLGLGSAPPDHQSSKPIALPALAYVTSLPAFCFVVDAGNVLFIS